jgi:hypothetical protein
MSSSSAVLLYEFPSFNNGPMSYDMVSSFENAPKIQDSDSSSYSSYYYYGGGALSGLIIISISAVYFYRKKKNSKKIKQNMFMTTPHSATSKANSRLLL